MRKIHKNVDKVPVVELERMLVAATVVKSIFQVVTLAITIIISLRLDQGVSSGFKEIPSCHDIQAFVADWVRAVRVASLENTGILSCCTPEVLPLFE